MQEFERNVFICAHDIFYHVDDAENGNTELVQFYFGYC